MIPRRIEEGHLQLAEERALIARQVVHRIHEQVAGAEEEVRAEAVDGVEVGEERGRRIAAAVGAFPVEVPADQDAVMAGAVRWKNLQPVERGALGRQR
jgi:phage terminase small subunit